MQMKIGSHIPVLVELLNITYGDVLEMGMGYFSTPVLHWLCKAQDRVLWSYENNPEYYNLFDLSESPNHFSKLVMNWNDANIEKYWDVALIDHAPAERRKTDIIRLANYAKYIVIHDTHWKENKHYHYEDMWSLFKYRWDYEVHCRTTVVSNFVDIKDLI